MTPETTKTPLIALCRTDGRMIAVNRALAKILAALDLDSEPPLSQLADLVGLPNLLSSFENFATAESAVETISLAGPTGGNRVGMQKITGAGGEELVLIELVSVAGGEGFLLEAGRLTSRLIHDFKNQLGGIKLYAAYLKKRVADHPEALEIAEKIILGLNTMADHAALISKLTRPLETKCQPTDLLTLIDQVANEQRSGIGMRQLSFEVKLAEGLPPVNLDPQLIRLALDAIIARAIEATPDGGTVTVGARALAAEVEIEIIDQGERLDDQELNQIFNFLTSARLNQTSLNLAMAKRIIEEHGGKITAANAATNGVLIQVKLPETGR